MPNVGDKDARFRHGAKVKIYLGSERFIGTGIVTKENEPTEENDQYSYVVRTDGGEGTYFANELLPIFDFGNLDKLAKTLAENSDSSFQEGDYWQAVLNIGYDMWQKNPDRSIGYSDMLSWVRVEYGEFAKFCILIGKYNQQVCNGGHYQYWDNRYAGDDEDDFTLHKEMIEYLGMSGLIYTSLGRKVYDVARRFGIITPDPYDWLRSEDENLEPYLKDEGVDGAYYAFNSEWEKFFGGVVRNAINEVLKESEAA